MTEKGEPKTDEDQKIPNIIYGGCKGCSLCYGYNKGMYVSPAEYNPENQTVLLRCQTKRRLKDLPSIINHEVLHDIIHVLGEDTNIIDYLKF